MSIKVALDPIKRQAHIDHLLELEGMGHIKEDPNAAYCPVSITSTPEELKQVIRQRQHTLMRRILAHAGITAYDPNSASFSQETDLLTPPTDIYRVDSGKIASARYFTGHNLLPSTGFGVEQEKAKTLVRVAVTLMDKNVRVGRMQPTRAIYLQYDDIERQSEEFQILFEMLKEFDPGVGFSDGFPVLIGFERGSQRVVDLEAHVYQQFPGLQYKYKGTVPILKLRSENPEIFYDYGRH